MAHIAMIKISLKFWFLIRLILVGILEKHIYHAMYNTIFGHVWEQIMDFHNLISF
jgi:hypothetical protein